MSHIIQVSGDVREQLRREEEATQEQWPYRDFCGLSRSSSRERGNIEALNRMRPLSTRNYAQTLSSRRSVFYQ